MDLPVVSQFRAAQPRAVSQLSQALALGRLHHALLFQGARATAVAPLARALAQALVCTAANGPDACGACNACRKFINGNHPDVHTLRPNDKGVIPVQAVRELSERLSLRATESRIKIAFIESAEAMPVGAQNALLKTLEEPPGDTCFILLTHHRAGVLATIRSRCQQLRLREPDRMAAVSALQDSGITPALAARLAPLCGADVPRAQGFVENGAQEIEDSLDAVLDEGVAPQTVFRVAADLGGDKERFELTLALFEVRLRDALACAAGARRSALACAAGMLQRLRRSAQVNANRAMALEGLFLSWAGKLQEETGLV
jgi:DNA polymerase-3 subunit delta'